MIWREKRVLLIVLGLLLAANTVFFFTYRVQYQSRLDDLDKRLETVEKELADARASRVATERRIQGYRKTEADITQVYDQHWSTQSKRFTTMFAEVKNLAEASGLVPTAYSFDRGEVKNAPGIAGGSPANRTRRREDLGAKEVGMSFNVQGTYEQVRRLINLFELSNQFVIIDSIGLSSSEEGGRLSLNIHVKTLFRDEPGAAPNRL
jgi:Tfp pilus assembly protein PilO